MKKQRDNQPGPQGEEKGSSKKVRNAKGHINPFKNAEVKEPKESPEEEADAEQQRKEALTERD